MKRSQRNKIRTVRMNVAAGAVGVHLGPFDVDTSVQVWSRQGGRCPSCGSPAFRVHAKGLSCAKVACGERFPFVVAS